jgi:hypothetical protein
MRRTLMAVLLCAASTPTMAAISVDDHACHGVECSVGARVRSSDAYLRAMIEEAARRSPTFRRLIVTIEATNGIVYVEHGNCLHGVRACLALDVTRAGDYRILRVTVDARQPDWHVMPLIGHELRHALEVLNDPGLVDGPRVFLFYAQHHNAKDQPFETDAAVETEDAVRKDLETFAKGRPK